MENEHVLSGLIRKRAELAGEIDRLSAMAQEKMIELDHLDGAIRIFDPNIDLETIKPKTIPPRHQALPGEMTRGVLTVLREAREPINSREITLRLMRRRTMNTADIALVNTVAKRVVACLRNNRNKGILKATETDGQMLLWEVAR